MDFQTQDDIRAAVLERVAAEQEPTGAAQDSGQQTNRASELKFLSACELCTPPSATDWVIKGFLTKRSLCDFYGESGCGKSFLACDMGLHIATDSMTSWHGHAIRHHGPVFYIAGEGISGVKTRLMAWARRHGVPLDQIKFFVSNGPVLFLEQNDVLELLAVIEKMIQLHGEPVLIIIDTLNRNFGPGDENNTADMTRFVSTIDGSILCRYDCAVAVVHHTGLTNKDRARGSYVLKAALDWEYCLKAGTNGIRTLQCTKSKDHLPPEDLNFRAEIVSIPEWIDPEDGEVMTSLVFERTDETPQSNGKQLTGARKIAFDVLCSFGDEYVDIDTWRAAAYSRGISPSSSQEAKQKAFRRAVTELVSAGIVKVQDDYYWTNPDMYRTCP